MTWETKLFTHYGECMCWFKFRTRNSHCKVCSSNKLIREILIEIAPFHMLHMIKLFHIKIRKTWFCHNSSAKVNNPPPISMATWVWNVTLTFIHFTFLLISLNWKVVCAFEMELVLKSGNESCLVMINFPARSCLLTDTECKQKARCFCKLRCSCHDRIAESLFFI